MSKLLMVFIVAAVVCLASPASVTPTKSPASASPAKSKSPSASPIPPSPSPSTTPSRSTPVPSDPQVADMRAAIKTAFGFPATGGTYGLACAPCAAGDNIGAVVRLAFHDAAGGGGVLGLGGPNGCIDTSTTSNNGLTTVIAQLDTARAPFASIVSRADFWVLAASVAIEVATTLAAGVTTLPQGLPPLPPSAPLRLPVRFGRVDDAACVGLDTLLPPASLSWAGIVSSFLRFGVTSDEVVALFGAHSVGRAETANSGFNGGWTATQSSFSNSYYRRLANARWTSTDAATSNVWTNGGGATGPTTIMLKTDVELGITSSSACTSFNPPVSPTAAPSPQPFLAAPGSTCPINVAAEGTVLTFASNQGAWWTTFVTGWAKLTEFRYALNAATGRLAPLQQ